MPKPISIFPALAFIVLALFIAGCGGGDDEATGSASDGTTSAESSGPPSKAEFTKQAEDLCYQAKRDRYFEARKYRRVHKEELEELSPIPSEEKIILAVELPSILKEAKELEALGAPKGDERKIEAIVTEIETGVEKAKKNPYSISLEVPSEYPFRKLNGLIRAYPLAACRNIA
jgi:hypothetical protein